MYLAASDFICNIQDLLLQGQGFSPVVALRFSSVGWLSVAALRLSCPVM